MRTLFLLMLVLLAYSARMDGQVPSPTATSDARILIRYGTAHLGTGEVLANALIEIQRGEISKVADGNTTRINASDYDTIIDVDGKHIYPGFIVMDSRLGLTEIDAVGATHDFDETGAFNANVRALPAFNTESKIISTVRANGVLMAQIAPEGGVISGRSSAVHFDGWDWQDATIRTDEGVFLNWPQRYRKTGWWAEPGGVKNNKKYEEELEAIHAHFKEAAAYAMLTEAHSTNLKMEALRGVVEGSDRLYIRVNWARDMLDAIQFVRAQKLQRVAIVGGAEALLVATELKENNIPVVIDRVHKLPLHEDSPLEEPFKLAGQLRAAGVEVAFATSGGMEAMISRNLPFQVGTAVHYGLEYEDAIRSVTLVPAQLLGIQDRYGSIEPGKAATFFISQGDALDIKSNNIIMAFIEGNMIDLSNHQLQLYEKFSKKHGVSGQ